jgi:hypothetical protein
MTMKTKTEERPATAAEMAAMNFEPWSAEDLEEFKPPSNVEFDKLAQAHLPTVRIAWLMLAKTKPELVETLRKIDNEIGRELMFGFIAATAFFKQSLTILENAEARILCAGSVIEIEDGEDDEEPATGGED